MKQKAFYLAPVAETVYLSHECAVMQLSTTKEDYGPWITNEWMD